jgi:hypothetical protein
MLLKNSSYMFIISVFRHVNGFHYCGFNIFYDIVILLVLTVLYMITIHYLKQQQLKSFKIPVLRKC